MVMAQDSDSQKFNDDLLASSDGRVRSLQGTPDHAPVPVRGLQAARGGQPVVCVPQEAGGDPAPGRLYLRPSLVRYPPNDRRWPLRAIVEDRWPFHALIEGGRGLRP